MSVVLENIVKRFGGTMAVDHVSLAVEPGEFVVLLGPSGCGKSTLLRIVAGLEAPESGSVLVDGRDVTALEPRARDLAMVFQNYALYPHMSVEENIGYPLRVRKRPQAEIAAEVGKAAAKLGLAELLGRKPRELSGGQRQRVALARAIVRRPKAFLMDEPLSNLDARLRVDTRFELKHLQHELGAATIYVTHDQAEAMTLAHRIAVMRDGKVLQFDTPYNIYNRPANVFVAGFLGSPQMNFISLPGEDTTLGVRPEDVEISPAPFENGRPATVYAAEEMGSETFIRISLPDKGRLTARVAADFRPDFDAQVWYRFREGRAHRFDARTLEAIRR
jgi:ABC-type sugar transport system ATPase subunit